MKRFNLRLATKLALSLASILVATTASALELLDLETDKQGMHRVTYEQLLEQGADLRGLKTRRMALSLDGEPVAVLANGQDRSFGSRAQFGPGGYIEFYAPGSNSKYTDVQTFTLHSLTNQQIRSGERVLIKSQRNAVDLSQGATSQYQFTKIEHQDNTYSFSTPIANDPWSFGFTISVRATPTYTFSLEGVAGGTANAKLEADMVGFVDLPIDGNDHHYEVLVNGVLLGDQQFDGSSVDTFSSEGASVSEGANTFKFNYRPLADVPFDRISLNEIRVTYPRTTVMTDGYIQGFFDASQVQVSNVSSARVYRRDPNGDIRRIIGSLRSGEGIIFSTQGQSGEYIVVSDEPGSIGFQSATVRALPEAQDIASGSAEYLIIAHPSLIGDELDELVAIRSEDYSVKLVDVNQVYAQFGNHNFGYQGIEAYIEHAVENMGTKYVLLVGNDTYDYTNNKFDSVSLMPTKYVETRLGGLRITQTASDAAYGDVDDNGIPDIAIGRIGARTKAEIAFVINKIKAYQAREGYVGRVLMATDKDDLGTGVNFTADAQDLIDAMPADWRGSLREDFRAFPEVDGHQEAHDKVIRLINAGVSVVEYIGHSSQYSWAFTTPPMLTFREIPGLTNVGKPAVITQWGCWNTYYVDPNGNTMGDRFMLGGENGGVAVLGASSLTTSEGERGLGIELNKRLFNDGVTIGEALIAAKKALAEKGDHPDIQLGWQILGDPALVVNP